MDPPPSSAVDSHIASAKIATTDTQLVEDSSSAPQKSNEPENSGPSSLATLAPQAETVEEMTLKIKWAGKEYGVRVCKDDSVGELKRRICEATSVLPKRQKLIGLNAKGKMAEDSMIIGRLALKANAKIMMVGSVESDILVEPEGDSDVVDDFVVPESEILRIRDRPENQHKLARRAAAYKMKMLNPPRPGKKLLVLDIDYTLFDHRTPAENPFQLMRPYLHEFLAASYSEYDIIIWSATGMKWVEAKMRELGVSTNLLYKITAYMDHLAMITVESPDHGVFDCKPLGVIWAHFPEYTPENTIMFDDLQRNFVMNPQNGLCIRPFRKAHMNRATDRELEKLTEYLLAIAELPILSDIDHRKWEKYMGGGRRQ